MDTVSFLFDYGAVLKHSSVSTLSIRLLLYHCSMRQSDGHGFHQFCNEKVRFILHQAFSSSTIAHVLQRRVQHPCQAPWCELGCIELCIEYIRRVIEQAIGEGKISKSAVGTND